MSGYVLHPEALTDIEEIWEYIARDNPEAAGRVVSEIFDTLRALVRFPRQGHVRLDLTSLPLRFQRVREYLIVVCSGQRSPLGRCSNAWPPQPSRFSRCSA